MFLSLALPRRIATLALLLAGMLSGIQARATDSPSESAVKAAFLYKFGSFVDWPSGVFRSAQDPLVIGVLGDEAVAADLSQLTAGRTVEGRPVQVRVARGSEIPTGVHLLFVGTVRPSRLREILAAVAPTVLVVTQQPGALAAGAVINFVTDTGRVRFATSLTSAEARGLRLSARLLAVAQEVEGRPR